MLMRDNHWLLFELFTSFTVSVDCEFEQDIKLIFIFLAKAQFDLDNPNHINAEKTTNFLIGTLSLIAFINLINILYVGL
jgi:hypothetical protein